MARSRPALPAWATGLSARLLALTFAFVMASEVLIFAPSAGRYRVAYLEQRLAAAHIAILALQATPDQAVSDSLQMELLDQARAYLIALRRPDGVKMVLGGENTPMADATFDLRNRSLLPLIGEAFMTLVQPRNRILRVIGTSPRRPDAIIEMVTAELMARKYAGVVRLEVSADMPENLRGWLATQLGADPADVIATPGLLSLGDLTGLPVYGHAGQRYPPHQPVTHPRLRNLDRADPSAVFEEIRRGDILVHLPYHSFDTSILQFIRSAAADPAVLAIKLTIYRTGRRSPIIQALKEAARHGKQVAVLVEITARFDEAPNISWGKELQEAGAHVAYGVERAKMNQLQDASMIRELYQASLAGVPIVLNVRGLCCLRAGVPGLSPTIQVYSTLGRFLEHSRIYRFQNGGAPEFFIGSADLMTRNLSRRMEVVAPVCDPAIKNELDTILCTYEQDNCSAWDMQPDGEYIRRHPAAGEARRSAQQMFIDLSAS